MSDEGQKPGKRRLDLAERALRRLRIFQRLRDGWAYEDIAKLEGVSGERIRQIVSETLRKRAVDDGSEHAKLQLERLAPALRLAADAIATGDVKAIVPYLKVLDRLDKYREVVGGDQSYGEAERERLLAKINAIAARVRPDEAERADRAAAATAEAAAESARENFALDSP